MNIDFNVNDIQTYIPEEPAAIIAKFDPVSKTFTRSTDGLDYIRGDKYIDDSLVVEQALRNSTTFRHKENAESANAMVYKLETSITMYKKMWENIPTIEDYFDLDVVNHVEESESLFYKASEGHGW